MQADTLEFYLLTLASFVASASNAYNKSLLTVFADDSQFCNWLEKIYLPKKIEQGKHLRTLVKKRWPDLNWEDAYLTYFRYILTKRQDTLVSKTPADIALEHCLAERKYAMFSAALAELNPLCSQATLLQTISTNALRNCTTFRNAYERFDDWQQLGIAGHLNSYVYSSTLPGAIEIQRAFFAIQENWYGSTQKLVDNYQSLQNRSARFLKRVWPIQEARRFMFVPYNRPSTLGYEAGIVPDLLPKVIQKPSLKKPIAA